MSRGLQTISGKLISIPDNNHFIHLQFRRFAGCPVCNLHLQSMAKRYKEIEEAGIHEVVVFHSAVGDLLVHANEFPFDTVADPQKRLYVEFGVESSPSSLLSIQAWWPIIRAVFNSLWMILKKRKPIPPINPHGGSLGLPADFLITTGGYIAACKYGVHVDDQWSVDELLSITRSIRLTDQSRKEVVHE